MKVMSGLSDEERRHWDENGFLIVKNCLNSAEVSRLTSELSCLADSSVTWTTEKKARHASTAGNGYHIDITGLPLLTEAVHFLMDHPNIFGRILSLMGPFIYIPGMEYLERHTYDKQILRLHTDGGGSLRCIFPSPDSLVLQLKIQFFLTDVNEPEAGNFMLVPASHRRKFPLGLSEIERATTTAVPIYASEGDALIFPWSLWHCVAPNKSVQSRKSIITRYAQLWMRPIEFEVIPEEILTLLSPRRQRLLANLPECKVQGDYYRPNLDLQIGEMFGTEWSRHPDMGRYVEMKRPLKDLLDQQ